MHNRYILNVDKERKEVVGSVVLLTIISVYSGQYLLWVINLLIVLSSLILNRGIIKSIDMPGSWSIILILCIGSFGGAFSYASANTVGLWPVLRDMIRATGFPLMWLALSAVLIRYKIFYRNSFYKTLFAICGISSIVDLIISFPERVEQLGNGFFAFAGAYSPDKYLIAIGAFLTLFKPLTDSKYYISMGKDLILKLAIIVNFALSFSRTAIVIVVLISFPFVIRYMGKCFKLVAGFVALFLILSLVMPELSAYFWYKIMRSFEEISYNGVWTETAVVSNWRGYEIFCAQQHFLNANLIHQIFGDGYGALLDVGQYSYLVTTEEGGIPFLHNGYYTALIKTGLIGLFLNIAYYLNAVYSISKCKVNTFDRKFMIGIVLSMAVSAWTVGGALIGYMVPLYTLVLVWLPHCKE